MMKDLPLTNKKKFIHYKIRDLLLPETYEVFYANNCEGIMLIWNCDMFNIKNDVYIRNLK